MHEFSIAQELVSQLKGLLMQYQRRRVTFIKLAIGRFSGVVVESLLFSLNALSEQESALKGMKVEVESSNVEYTCNGCGHNFQPEHSAHTDPINIFQALAVSCPLCGHEFCSRKGGDELLLLTVEME